MEIFWLITFTTSLCICSYLIYNVWFKWKVSPVLVAISEKLVPVREVPFPSVTICPQSKLLPSKYNYSSESNRIDVMFETGSPDEIMSNLENITMFEDILLVCSEIPSHYSYESFINFSSTIENITRSVTDRIIRVAPKKEDIFVLCVWQGIDDYNCSKTLTEVLTSEGLCYNVNSLSADDILRGDNNIYFKASKNTINWSMDKGYSSLERDVYPSRGKELGANPDLEIVFKDKKIDRDPLCNIINSEFNKVYIHHPADLPQSSLHYFAVRNEEVSSIALSFSIINTSLTVKEYPLETRQCYFPNERYLKYFKIYTAKNCMMECIANITVELCGCAEFYMPHENTTRTCSLLKYYCVLNASDTLVYREANNSENACQCLPLCYSIEYEAEILKTAFHVEKLYKFKKIPTNNKFPYLQMFYKGSRFVSMHRSELFGRTDFFANIGGLLSLFLGFSFLSLIEFFYYLTLRLFCALRKDHKQEKLQRRKTVQMKPPELLRH